MDNTEKKKEKKKLTLTGKALESNIGAMHNIFFIYFHAINLWMTPHTINFAAYLALTKVKGSNLQQQDCMCIPKKSGPHPHLFGMESTHALRNESFFGI